jgi:hypothetical protein
MYKNRVLLGCGGYGIEIPGGKVFDAYNYRKKCMCSYANTPRNCFDTSANRNAVANCYITIDMSIRPPTISLRCKRYQTIKAHTELSWSYGVKFKVDTSI